MHRAFAYAVPYTQGTPYRIRGNFRVMNAHALSKKLWEFPHIFGNAEGVRNDIIYEKRRERSVICDKTVTHL